MKSIPSLLYLSVGLKPQKPNHHQTKYISLPVCMYQIKPQHPAGLIRPKVKTNQGIQIYNKILIHILENYARANTQQAWRVRRGRYTLYSSWFFMFFVFYFLCGGRLQGWVVPILVAEIRQ